MILVVAGVAGEYGSGGGGRGGGGGGLTQVSGGHAAGWRGGGAVSHRSPGGTPVMALRIRTAAPPMNPVHRSRVVVRSSVVRQPIVAMRIVMSAPGAWGATPR